MPSLFPSWTSPHCTDKLRGVTDLPTHHAWLTLLAQSSALLLLLLFGPLGHLHGLTSMGISDVHYTAGLCLTLHLSTE